MSLKGASLFHKVGQTHFYYKFDRVYYILLMSQVKTNYPREWTLHTTYEFCFESAHESIPTFEFRRTNCVFISCPNLRTSTLQQLDLLRFCIQEYDEKFDHWIENMVPDGCRSLLVVVVTYLSRQSCLLMHNPSTCFCTMGWGGHWQKNLETMCDKKIRSNIFIVDQF